MDTGRYTLWQKFLCRAVKRWSRPVWVVVGELLYKTLDLRIELTTHTSRATCLNYGSAPDSIIQRSFPDVTSECEIEE